MITIDEARKLTAQAYVEIEGRKITYWLSIIEKAIKTEATKGRSMASILLRVTDSDGDIVEWADFTMAKKLSVSIGSNGYKTSASAVNGYGQVNIEWYS